VNKFSHSMNTRSYQLLTSIIHENNRDRSHLVSQYIFVSSFIIITHKKGHFRICSVRFQSMWIEWDWMGLNHKQVKLLLNFSNPIQSMINGINRTRL
jgi:hypothetical protein